MTAVVWIVGGIAAVVMAGSIYFQAKHRSVWDVEGGEY